LYFVEPVFVLKAGFKNVTEEEDCMMHESKATKRRLEVTQVCPEKYETF